MSAPCAPGGFEQAQRHDFGHHRDQQRALGMGGFGDGPQIADQAEHVRDCTTTQAVSSSIRRDDVFGAARRHRRALTIGPNRPATVSTVSA